MAANRDSAERSMASPAGASVMGYGRARLVERRGMDIRSCEDFSHSPADALDAISIAASSRLTEVHSRDSMAVKSSENS